MKFSKNVNTRHQTHIVKMEKQSNNKDLLLCENQFFLAKNKPENLFNFNNKENNVDKCSKNDMTSFKTEKLTSNGLFFD